MIDMHKYERQLVVIVVVAVAAVGIEILGTVVGFAAEAAVGDSPVVEVDTAGLVQRLTTIVGPAVAAVLSQAGEESSVFLAGFSFAEFSFLCS